MAEFSDNPHGPQQHTLFRLDAFGRLKTREVWEPNDETRVKHGEMLRRLYDLNIHMPHAFGGLPGKSLRDNVRPHVHNDVFYMLDIKNAYASVDIDYLQAQADHAVLRNGGSNTLRRDLAAFIKNDAVIDDVPGLPLGYPASPFLFNLYCQQMDGQLGYALSQLPWDKYSHVRYTRWLDDLTFSAPYGELSEHKRRAIRDIVQAVPGFEIETRKTRRHKLGSGAVTITGLSVYPDGRVTPAPALLDKVVSAFDDADAALEKGAMLSEEELYEIHGLNSILHMAGDPERSGSRLVRGLHVRYQDIARRSLGMKSI